MRVWVAATAIAIALAPGCQSPTQISFVVTTDIPCDQVTETGVAVSSSKDLESRDFSTTAPGCNGGKLGTLVVIPSGDDRGAEVAVRIVTGLGHAAQDCVDNKFKGGCVVARRIIRFLPHTPLTAHVTMAAACRDNPCDPTSTCEKGVCVSAIAKCGGGECALGTSEGTDAGAPAGEAGTTTPPTATALNRWRAMSKGPLTARDTAFTAWTGKEVMIWGGVHPGGHDDTGALYDPKTDTWRSMPQHLSARVGGVAVWTGTEIIVWGGFGTQDYADGARFDPVTSTWTDMATAPYALAETVGVWAETTGEMLVWSGSQQGAPGGSQHGLAYNPKTNTWKAMPTPQLTGRRAASAVWLQDKMFVYGGDGGGSAAEQDYATYDPKTETWSTSMMPTNPRARAFFPFTVVGDRAFAWGGTSHYNDYPGNDFWSDGVVFDASGGRTQAIPSPTETVLPGAGRKSGGAFGADGKLWVWGGVGGALDDPSDTTSRVARGNGAVFDPATNTWTAMTSAGAVPSPRSRFSLIWTGTEAIVWGGVSSDATKDLDDGSVLGP